MNFVQRMMLLLSIGALSSGVALASSASGTTSVARYNADTLAQAIPWCAGFEAGVPTDPQSGWTFNTHCTIAADPAGGYAVMDNLTYNVNGDVRIDYWDFPGQLYDPLKDLGNSCHCAGDPINVATGNEYRDDQDLSLGALSFHRYYNSFPNVTSSHIGANWRHSFDRSVKYTSTNNPATASVLRPDGKVFTFTLTSGQWLSDSDVTDRLTQRLDASGNLIGWTYFVAANRNQENFDQSGNLTSIVDANGMVTTLSYSTASTPTNVAPTAGLLLTVTDPYGRTLNFTYNTNAQAVTVAAPDGRVVSYAYDRNGNLVSVTYPDQSSITYLYNENSLSSATVPHLLTGDIDETGSRYASISYDNYGQAFQSTLASGVDKTTVSYGSNGAATVTYPTGVNTTLNFVVTSNSLHTNAVSAPCGLLCSEPNTASSFDVKGYPATTTDFDGNVTKTTYDLNGLLDQQVDASGSTSQRTTNFTWNMALRVPLSRVVLDASGNTVSSTQWVYNSAGQTLARCEIDTANSAASRYTCSNTGTAPAGVRRWTYTYCTAVDTTQCPIVGLMLTAAGPRTDTVQTTTYSYYMASSSTNCGTPGAACYQAGDLHTVTDAQGHVTTIASYDADGRTIRIADANGINTNMTYTPRGWLASRSMGNATTSFTYTAYGAVQTVTDPDGIATTYGYDAAHRLVKITDAQGNYIQYTLDAAGNKTAEQVYDSSGTLHKSLTRTFNTLGQLTKVMDGINHTIFDASASNSYDANGNLMQSADGLGIQRQQSYDALNRLVQTIDNYNGTN